jgi:hypothetical protein
MDFIHLLIIKINKINSILRFEDYEFLIYYKMEKKFIKLISLDEKCHRDIPVELHLVTALIK